MDPYLIDQLKALRFSDIYLNGQVAWLKGTEEQRESLLPMPSELLDITGPLHAACVAGEERTRSPDFAVDFHGMRFRVAVMKTVEGGYYVARRFPDAVPNLLDLGLPGFALKRLVQRHLTGLVAVVGATGSGKTTTSSALVKYLLERYGGVAVAIEDPPEMPLHGLHGRGTCFQVEVTGNDFAAPCRAMLRWHPDIIFLGEVRDPAAAAEALRASMNGHRVVCTIHADGVEAGIQRLHALAGAETHSDTAAASLLSQGLSAVLFQRLVSDGTPRIESEFLFLKGNEGASARAHIGAQNFKMLQAEVESQKRRLDPLRT